MTTKAPPRQVFRAFFHTSLSISLVRSSNGTTLRTCSIRGSHRLENPTCIGPEDGVPVRCVIDTVAPDMGGPASEQREDYGEIHACATPDGCIFAENNCRDTEERHEPAERGRICQCVCACTPKGFPQRCVRAKDRRSQPRRFAGQRVSERVTGARSAIP